MKQCPRCENEQLKEEYKHCPICGVNLNEEIKKAGVDVLKFLMNSYIEKECNDSEEEEFKKLIVGALGVAIEELEKNSEEELDKKILNLDRETTSRIAPLTRAIIGYATRKEISLDELEIVFKIAKENYILIHNNKNKS
ncbi:hypothetical protein [Clostridium sp.]|uniref:hypothetical protein n=1 Tax=Clostridium sp. TaxID=1506 RepID=UPI0025BD993C|nr:hypothetical protein [Clostridium sp.]